MNSKREKILKNISHEETRGKIILIIEKETG